MWSATMDVGDWLRSLGLGQYEEKFRDNKVDADVLPELTADDLRDIGVVAVGDRRRLLAAIAALVGTRPSSDSPVFPLRSAPRTGSQVPAERRPITVMFCDLVGSTSLASRLDAEDWRNLVTGYLDEASSAVTGLGGHVLKRLGDGLMALFGYPAAQENDAERAVRAALSIQRALAEINAKNARNGMPELCARIGLEAGPVVIDATGEIFGDAPNVAARVQAVAEPGSVLVTMNVHRQVAGLFIAEERGAHELKGLAAPIQLFRIVRASGAGRRSGTRTSTPFVGRDEELGLLARRWTRSRGGEGQFVLIVGEPGLGKSRLIEQFHATLAEVPHTWVEWSASQLLQNTPLHPVAEWGRARFGGADVAPETRLAELESSLRQAQIDADENATLLAPLLDIPLPLGRVPSQTAEELRRRRLAALVSWLIAGARAQPMVLAFEDLQWSDPTSIDVLRALAERGGQAPLLLIATTRLEFRPTWAMRLHHSVMSLAPLDRVQVRTMISEMAWRHSLSNEVVEGVNQRTGGVPLFVEEVTRLLLESGGHGGARAIPPTLQQSLAARLDRLGSAREVAQIGAVLGRDFTYSLLRNVAGMDEPVLQAALERLAEADILFLEGLLPHANYRFKHALIQDAAYESLLRSRRNELHARTAKILEERLPELAEQQPELVARHCTEAGLIERAILHWGKAGRKSAAQSAMTEAVAQLSKGLELVASLPESQERQRQELGLQSVLAGVLAAFRGLAAPETGRAYARARALCEGLGDFATLFPVLSGQISALAGRAEHVMARQGAEDLLRLAESRGDSGSLMVANRSMGHCLHLLGDFAGAARRFERVLALYDPETHRVMATVAAFDMRAVAHANLSWDLLLLGFPRRATTQIEQALAWGREVNHPHTMLYMLTASATFYRFRRDEQSAESVLMEMLQLALPHNVRAWLPPANVLRGRGLVARGDVAAGLALAREGISEKRAQGTLGNMTYFLALLAECCHAAGELDEAERLLVEALELADATEERWFEAELHRLRGEWQLLHQNADPHEVEACYFKALTIARSQGARWWELHAAMCLARLRSDQRKFREAHDLLAPVFSRFTEGFDTPDLTDASRLLGKLQEKLAP
jgi:class 3 adenylate cyclase/predicted ATPase